LSTTKVVTTLVIALILGFAGGFVAQFFVGNTSDSDLSSQINAVKEKVADLESNMSSFVSTGELQKVKSTIDNLKQNTDQSETQSSQVNWDQIKFQLDDLANRVQTLETKGTSSAPSNLKVGYVNATEAFTVFTGAVKEERDRVSELQQKLLDLRNKAIQGEITESEYKEQSDILQAKRLKAQLQIDLAMVDKMIESKGFSTIADKLKELRNQAQPIVDELDKTLTRMEEKSASPEEVQGILSQINNQYSQMDDLLTRLIESKMFQVTTQLAKNRGYDMVFREKNVLLSSNEEAVDNLTDATKQILRQEIS